MYVIVINTTVDFGNSGSSNSCGWDNIYSCSIPNCQKTPLTDEWTCLGE